MAVVAWLWDVCTNYFLHGIGTTGGRAIQVIADPYLQHAAAEFRTLLERIANGKSLADIEDACQVLYEDGLADEAFWQWYLEANALTYRVRWPCL